jgi:hypothetical protein
MSKNKRARRALEDAAHLLRSSRRIPLSDSRERIACLMVDAASPEAAFAAGYERAALAEAALRLANRECVSVGDARAIMFRAGQTSR